MDGDLWSMLETLFGADYVKAFPFYMLLVHGISPRAKGIREQCVENTLR